MEAPTSQDWTWRSQLKGLVLYRRHHLAKADHIDINDNFADKVYHPGEDNLGPHGNEKHMPRWLHKVLERGDEITTREVLDANGTKTFEDLKVVETPGIIAALVRLSNAEPTVSRAVYCSPLVHHVARLRREGSFCGYRNIQMMVSYVRGAKLSEHHLFDQQPLPSIFLLQELIEDAWHRGFNASVGKEVGPLRMTRKFIGTSEAEALFLSLDVPVTTQAFISTPTAQAHQFLIEYVSEYFEIGDHLSHGEKVVLTEKPPIFLQRPGHSMTIIGIDQDSQGSRSLMVFDPHDRLSKRIRRLALGGLLPSKPEKLLRAYRYSERKLAKYSAFEIVRLEITPSSSLKLVGKK